MKLELKIKNLSGRNMYFRQFYLMRKFEWTTGVFFWIKDPDPGDPKRPDPTGSATLVCAPYLPLCGHKFRIILWTIFRRFAWVLRRSPKIADMTARSKGYRFVQCLSKEQRAMEGWRADMQTDRQTDRVTDKQTDRQTDRQTDGQTNRRADMR